jgi:hypothetical protein
MILVIQAYQADPKLSLRRVAQIYNINHQRLFDRMNGTQACSNYIPNGRKLSN